MTELSPAPPKTPKAAATRSRLLAAAHRLFIDHGYSAVSLNDIALTAGLTKGAIYGHFRSKGQLLIEVIRSELAERDERAGGAEQTMAATEMVPSFVDDGARELRLLQVDAAAAARHDPDVAAGLRQLVADRQAWIADLSATAAPTKADFDAEAFAFVVTALAQGVGALEAGGAEPPDGDRFASVVTPMLAATFR
ncbi:MAG: TetR/AcrR family transcriptional regulator [Acidimicrobiia bacterium]|nr:TetR/AcrR family transcriptional regulator [Acidimicrobiia bacterium]